MVDLSDFDRRLNRPWRIRQNDGWRRNETDEGKWRMSLLSISGDDRASHFVPVPAAALRIRQADESPPACNNANAEAKAVAMAGAFVAMVAFRRMAIVASRRLFASLNRRRGIAIVKSEENFAFHLRIRREATSKQRRHHGRR